MAIGTSSAGLGEFCTAGGHSVFCVFVVERDRDTEGTPKGESVGDILSHAMT